jgi:hypothetical protein
MRPGNLSGGLGQLQSALKDWRVRREETMTGWNDGVRHEFEEQYCTPLESDVTAVARSLEELSAILEQLKRDVS